MENTPTLETQDSTTEPASAALDPTATESKATDEATEPALAGTTAPFRFLQTGAPELDELLRQKGVAKGGAVHLDFADTQKPLSFLLSACKAALGRGERVAFVAAPSIIHLDADFDDNNTETLAGCQLLPDFAEGVAALGLDSFINREEPGAASSQLRYLVASTPEEFEGTMEDLLGDGTSRPDVIVLWGLENLFDHVPQGTWDEMGWEEEVALVQRENERLCRWLETYGQRCREVGSTLFLSRGAQPYDSPGATLFLRGLRPLLTAHCEVTLFVAHTQYQCVCCECPWVVPGVAALPAYLYQRSALQGFAFALVKDDENTDGFDGPFLDEAQLAEIPARMAAFLASLDQREPTGVAAG